MGQMLIDVIFNALNYLANFFLAPVISLAAALIPGLTEFFSAITTYLGYGLQYVSFFCKLFMIPTAPLITLVSLFVGLFAFNITIRTVGLGMAIYRYFKP